MPLRSPRSRTVGHLGPGRCRTAHRKGRHAARHGVEQHRAPPAVAWVSEEEVRRVVEFWRAQVVDRRPWWPLTCQRITRVPRTGRRRRRDPAPSARTGDKAPVGFNVDAPTKAANRLCEGGRIMDQLEEEGVVAAGDGSKSKGVEDTRRVRPADFSLTGVVAYFLPSPVSASSSGAGRPDLGRRGRAGLIMACNCRCCT